ncbi:IS3 family transposase [Paenibacillus lentus]
MESLFGHLKRERLNLQNFTSQKQLIEEIHRYIPFTTIAVRKIKQP